MAEQKSFFKKAMDLIPEVRQEAIKKVTWPTRKETLLTTTFVFVFALIAATYFLIVDQVVFRLIRWVTGIGS